jgi:hypothetical protein
MMQRGCSYRLPGALGTARARVLQCASLGASAGGEYCPAGARVSLIASAERRQFPAIRKRAVRRAEWLPAASVAVMTAR